MNQEDYDNRNVLKDQLRLLDLKLLKQLEIYKNGFDKLFNHDNIGFITSEEVASLCYIDMNDETGFKNTPEMESIDEMITELEEEIEKQLSEKSFYYPILRLKRAFGLNDIEIVIIMMALAVEINRKYEKIYAYFNDDMTKKAPSVELTLNLLFHNYKESRWELYRLFFEDSSLLFFELIQFTETTAEEGFLSKRYKIDKAIMRFLLVETPAVNQRINKFAELYCTDEELPVLTFSDQSKLRDRMEALIDKWSLNRSGLTVFWLYGKGNDLKETLIDAMSGKFKMPVIKVDLEDILHESDFYAILRLIFREAILYSAFLFFKNGDLIYGASEKEKFLRVSLIRVIKDIPWLIFISANNPWIPEKFELKGQWYPLNVTSTGYNSRKEIWSNALKDTTISEGDINVLSWKFNFDSPQIMRSIRYARDVYDNGDITAEALYRACNIKPFSDLDRFSTKIASNYRWDDLVLPEHQLSHLKEVVSSIINRHTVYEEWGFEKKLSLKKGVNILFSGPSGTGKTMSIGIIASEINMEAYRINLASVVSKYIGETEKNLENIFNDPDSGNVILFFDEADSLFGKRSEVKDAHDRYANLETNYLLQKIEEHEGVIVLATNMNKNIDSAFLRRIHFTLEFPFPDEVCREKIWKNIFPGTVPISNDIDYKLLGQHLTLSGGNIKNIAVTAAFYGARDGSEVSMQHIMKAADREYHKMGKTFIN